MKIFVVQFYTQILNEVMRVSLHEIFKLCDFRGDIQW